MLGLPDGFAALWADPATAHQTKKRLVRLLVDDVTMVRGEDILVQVRLKGGAERTLRLPVLLSAVEIRRTPAEVVRLVDELLVLRCMPRDAARCMNSGIECDG